MKKPSPHTSLRVVMLGAALTVGACNDKRADAPPLAKYWTPVAAHLAGSFAGQCARVPGGARAPGSAVINPTGRFNFDGLTGDFRTMEGTYLSRTAVGGGPDQLLIRASFGSGGDVKFQSGPGGKGSVVTYQSGPTYRDCAMPAVAFPLTGKPLYVIYASVLDTAPTRIACGFNGETMLNYSFKDGSVTLGDLDYDLSGMDEDLVLNDNASRMRYRAAFKDGTDISISFDKHGKRGTIHAVTGGSLGRGGTLLPCGAD